MVSFESGAMILTNQLGFWIRKSWMLIAFFIGFFVVWEGVVAVFCVPLYILARHPSSSPRRQATCPGSLPTPMSRGLRQSSDIALQLSSPYPWGWRLRFDPYCGARSTHSSS